MNDSEAGKEVMKELAPEDAFMHASGPYAVIVPENHLKYYF